MAMPKRHTKKIFSNFTSVKCSVAKITSHIYFLSLVILQHLVWEKVLLHNFWELGGVIFNNFTVIANFASKITSHVSHLLLLIQQHFTHYCCNISSRG